MIGTRQAVTGNSDKAKVLCFALCAVIFAHCLSAEAQQPTKIARIGYLAPTIAADQSPFDAFRQGLRDRGYVEVKTLSLNSELMKES